MSQYNVQLQNGNGPLAGFRNQLINGSVLVDQRGTETTPVDLSGAGYTYGPDRWAIRGQAGTEYDFRQVEDGPNSEFVYSARARAKGSSTSTATVVQMIELNKVGGSAPFSLNSTYTFSAWVKTTDATSISATVRFTDTIMASGGADNCTVSPASVSVTAGTWTKVEFQVTTPAAITVTTAAALYVGIKTEDVTTASYTGLQFEPGPICTPFEERPIGLELSLCQRYFVSYRSRTWNLSMYKDGNPSARIVYISNPVTMRTNPTATVGQSFAISSQAVNAYTPYLVVSGTSTSSTDASYIGDITLDAEL